MVHVVVIGAGVIGLSTALRLQDEGHQVTIVARDLPAPSETADPETQIDYASAWAGAHSRFVPPPPPPPGAPETGAEAGAGIAAREHAFLLRTHARMRELRDEGSAAEAGLTFVRAVEHLEAGAPALAAYLAVGARDGGNGPGNLGLHGFRLLPPAELPPGVAWGCEYDTWCVHPMLYCAFLLRRVTLRGGQVVRRQVRAPEEVAADPTICKGNGKDPAIVVNASGTGFGDPDVFIVRGQTCLVAEECSPPTTITRQNGDGTWTFCIPRGYDGGTVIGGTREPGNWDPRPSSAVRQRLLRRFVENYPRALSGGRERDEQQQPRVLRDIVGRRPFRRGGMRLEAEEVQGIGVADGGRATTVVHAYGLGGRGYELSWGVAEEVARLIKKQIAAQARPKL